MCDCSVIALERLEMVDGVADQAPSMSCILGNKRSSLSASAGNRKAVDTGRLEDLNCYNACEIVLLKKGGIARERHFLFH